VHVQGSPHHSEQFLAMKILLQDEIQMVAAKSKILNFKTADNEAGR